MSNNPSLKALFKLQRVVALEGSRHLNRVHLRPVLYANFPIPIPLPSALCTPWSLVN